MTVVIKNSSGGVKTYAGQQLADNEEYTIQAGERDSFSRDTILFTDVASGDAEVGNGTEFYSALEGWSYLVGSTVKAEITQTANDDGTRIAIHDSTKPIIDGRLFYATWVGAGDDMTTGAVSGGDLAYMQFGASDTELTKDAHFHPNNGKTFLFDGYIQWENAAPGDSVSVEVRAKPTLLQQVANLDLVVDGDGWISYSLSGPGTGTHGFAATPALILRSFSKDGQWDYDAVNGLTPNFTNTGKYKLSTNDKLVHKFVNRVPLLGSSEGVFKLSSNEATEIPPGLYIRITGNTGANKTGNLRISTFMYLWREVTGQP